MKALLSALLIAAASRADSVFYVSPSGNDQWTGTKQAATGTDGPFQSLDRALQAARVSGGSRKVLLKGGSYRLDKPIRITAEDSGSEKEPLVIAAAKGEHPVLSGGRVIQGWTKDAANARLWHATIPAVREGKWFFRQLFINGTRKTRARTPNSGFFRIQGASPQEKPVKLPFKAGDIKKAWSTGDVEVIALLAWSDIRMQIRAVDDEKHIATLSGEARPSNRENNARYWLENAPEFLDSPGEWYLDRHSGVLSYLAEAGEDMQMAEVIAPALEDLVLIEGSETNAVHDIRFSGIEFAHTDWTLPDNGYADTQAAVATRGDVRGEFAERIGFVDCRFMHLAGYGLDLGQGCKNWRVAGNEIEDLGAGGIRIGEPKRPRNAAEENFGHRVTDNHLHRLGRVYAPAVGIFVMQSGTNRIAYNHIHDLYYTAISIGWNWGYQETPCRENIIEYNHLHDVGQEMLSDMGAIYTLGIQHGTVIRHNLIHDVSSFAYGGWGLYTDEGSTGILLEDNIVYHCKSAGFHQHYGRENVLRNNIIAFNRENQLMRTRAEAHTSFIFTNNIVYFDSGNLLGSNWSNDHYIMDHNIYYDTRFPNHPEKVLFAGESFSAWQKRGHDQHSRIADPGFAAPEKFDFHLRTDSPARAMGFREIDASQAGVRPPERRDN